MPDLNTEPAEVSLGSLMVESETVATEPPPSWVPSLKMDTTIFSDWWEFVRNVPPDAPYDLLNQLPFHRGFVYAIKEDGAQVHDQTITVTFSIRIGRTMSDLYHLDTFTLQVPRNTVAPSLAARSIAMPSVIYTIFGRLPPEQPPVAEPQPVPVQRAAPTPVPAPAPEPVEEAPWREGRTPPKPRRQPVPDNLIRERTMDGLPIVINLYELDVDTHEGVDRIIALFEDEAERLTDVGQLRALYTVNKEDTVGAVQYVQDFATPEQAERLHTLFRRREQLLSRRR